MSSQLEQLLTCCICLDRFRNPKLLPCQHSVCMEPCMEGLVDYVRRQVKCPECRAEHRLPYNGVQGFPANVTLQRFLEAHIEITGETPDPHTGQIMERCAVCNEKNYLSVCAHCEKKICTDCKAAHTEILKREIGRINNQVKRAVHRLNDQLNTVERNITALKSNTNGVSDEIEQISKRLQKAVRDRCQNLKEEVENYYNTELRNMTHMKEGLDQEISNIDSNIELAEKHMDDHTPWDDCELMDTKDIFLKTMEFIRSFDYEPGTDYNRRARFNPPDDLNKLASQLANLGELVIQHPKQMNDSYGSDRGLGPGLMKSKSDHRLTAQFRDNDDSYSYGSGRTSPVPRRRFGDRPVATDRYDGHDSAYDSPSESRTRRFRSRFMRRGEDEEEKSVRFADAEEPPKRQIRVMDTEDVARGPLSGILRLFDSPRVLKRLQERDKAPKKKEEPPKPVTSTTPRTPTTPQTPAQRKTSRQASNEDEIDKIKKQNKAADSSTSSTAVSSTPSTPTSPSTTTTTSSSRPDSARVTSLRDGERVSRADRTSVSPRSSSTHSPTSSVVRDDDSSSGTVRSRREYGRATVSGPSSDYSATSTGSSRTTPARKTSVDTGPLTVSQRSYPFSRSSSTSSVGESTKTSGTRSPRPLDTATLERRLSRSNSTDSNKSHDGSTSPRKATGAAFSTDELKNRFSRGSDTKSSTASRYSTDTTTTTPSSRSGAGSSRFQSRFLARAGTPSAEASKELGNDDDEEEETSDDSESEESEESSDEDEEEEKDEVSSPFARSDGWPLGRSAQNRDTSSSSKSSTAAAAQEKSFTTVPPSSNDSGYSSRYGSSSDNSSASSSGRYGSSSASSSTNSNTDSSSSGSYRRPSAADATRKDKEEDFDSRYPLASKYLSRSRANVPEEETTTKPTFQSRFLNRSKSSAVLGPDASNDDDSSGTGSSTMGAGRARFEELKERRQRLARSKSSAGLDDDDNSTSTDTPATSSYRSRFGRDSDTTSPTSPRTSTVGATGGDDSGSSTSQLSNWARYLKNKYGNRTTGTSGVGSTSSGLGSSSTTGAGSSSLGTSSLGSARSSGTSSSTTASGRPISRSRSSHLLGLAKEGESSEDDSKNVHATPTTQAAAGTQVPTPFASLHRSQYLQKQRLLLKIGSRGSEPGSFTWPRGIAVGPDNSIVVADSSNHRVQVFDQSGSFVKEFGSYGSGEGEFDCLAGVAVNRIGQFIIADRYNHRIQVFDPSGMFLRAFGSQGSGDGKFSYPWGVTTDALGFIYVCDKENHRVQVFQSDGTFVGKFGSMGNKPGQLEHPHYIAVSSTNRVIVSDSNNHRIQVFDINGKVTTTFGAEGSDEGQFKFPRGVAVDDQGYIFVADSGNNRIQIFHPEGSFLRAFGCWGSGEGEFKGLEGVAVMSNGNILVCDRENHRIQVF